MEKNGRIKRWVLLQIRNGAVTSVYKVFAGFAEGGTL
jgi:hypothetical protein